MADFSLIQDAFVSKQRITNEDKIVVLDFRGSMFAKASRITLAKDSVASGLRKTMGIQ